MKINKTKILTAGHIMDHGHPAHIDDIQTEGFQELTPFHPSVCPFFVCNVAIETGRNCADYHGCRTYKFKMRYDGIDLGIGGMVDFNHVKDGNN